MDCLRILVDCVIGGDDFFGLRFGDVRTPIRHDTVGLDGFGFVFVATQSAVASDDMHGHSGRHRDGVDSSDESVVWREVVDAVRDAIELELVGMEGGELESLLSYFEKQTRGADQAGSDAAEPVGGEVTATERSGNKDHAADFGA